MREGIDLEVKLPYDAVCPSVGLSIGRLVGWSVMISYRSTYFIRLLHNV